MTMSALSRRSDFTATLELFPGASLGHPHAKTSAAPTPRARASTVSVRPSSSKPSASPERSELSHESLAFRALVGSVLRTALISEIEDLTGSSLRWKKLATPANRSWWVLATTSEPADARRPASEPITSAPDHGFSASTHGSLPTPMAQDGQRGGAGGGAGSTYPFRMILSTPRASDMQAGGHGDTGRMGTVRHQLHQAMLATPRKTDADRGGRGDVLSQLRGYPSKHAGMPVLPTPTKRDKRMDAWSPAYDKRKSPGLDAVMSRAMVHTPTTKANQTAPSMMKWAGARALAEMLQAHGLSGTAALPITYGWMMGYPPGWLARALRSAVLAGRLQLASSSKRSATPSSPKSPKQSGAPS